MAPRRLKEGLLARVNFPLYSVEMLTSRHVLVAGGGGSSNTGVANGFVSIAAHVDFMKICLYKMFYIEYALFICIGNL